MLIGENQKWELFYIAKMMLKTNQDIIDEKYIKNRLLATTGERKKIALSLRGIRLGFLNMTHTVIGIHWLRLGRLQDHYD